MKTTVHTCDICKQSKSEGDLAHLSVSCNGISTSHDRNYSKLEIDACKDCLKKKGFVVEHAPNEKAEATKSNDRALRDKLLDILSDLDVMFHE